MTPSVVLPYCRVNKVEVDLHVEEKDAVIQQSKIEWMPSDANNYQNIKHIDFIIPPVTAGCPPSQIRVQHGALLKKELII